MCIRDRSSRDAAGHPAAVRRGRRARQPEPVRGDDLPAQHRPRRGRRPRPGAADRPATAVEMAATGLNWTFGPCVAVVQDIRWGRSYESFGSDPALVSAMTTAITGYQEEGILATAKHYLADGGTAGGVDQGDAQISEDVLRAVHLPPYAAAVERGVGSVMVSFSSWNGQKMHGNRYLITDLLKGELGFAGFVSATGPGSTSWTGPRASPRTRWC